MFGRRGSWLFSCILEIFPPIFLHVVTLSLEDGVTQNWITHCKPLLCDSVCLCEQATYFDARSHSPAIRGAELFEAALNSADWSWSCGGENYGILTCKQHVQYSENAHTYTCT